MILKNLIFERFVLENFLEFLIDKSIYLILFYCEKGIYVDYS